MNRESVIQMLNRLSMPLNELNWKGQLIAAFDDLTARNLALVEENGKLKTEIEDKKSLIDAITVHCNEFARETETLKAERNVALNDLFTARTERDSYKNLAKASEDSCVILIKSLEALRKTLSEKTLNIEYLHKAMDAQQKALDKLRQADLPGTNPPSCGSSVVSDSPPFDPTKTGVFPACGVMDAPSPRIIVGEGNPSFTQSGRCRARQLLNDLSTNPVQGYAGHRESQLVDVLLLILDELPKPRTIDYTKVSNITDRG